MDIQKVVSAPDLLAGHADDYGWTPAQLTGVRALKDASDESLRSMGRAEMSSLRSALDQALVYEQNHGDLARALSARGLQLHIDYALTIDPNENQAFRDFAMAEMVLLALRMRPNDGISVWAHNGHVSKDIAAGPEAMGSFLEKDLGEKYFAIGSFIYAGAARAWDGPRELGVVSHTLGAAPFFSVEAVALGDANAVFVNLRDAAPAFKRWLSVPRYVREFGSVYPGPRNEWSLRWVQRAYDAIAVYRTGSPTSPTATGGRVPSHATPPVH